MESAAVGPIVEVALDVDRQFAAEADAQLTEQLADLLALPGVCDARIVIPEQDDGPLARRLVLLFLDGDRALREEFADPSALIRSLLADPVDAHTAIRYRILQALDADIGGRPRCANCDALLAGQYCGHCGQRATDRVISLWELLRDATGDLFELDSRLWRTLIPLATRPGRLTADYLAGRRVRYMPPFRTYLVLSLIFFVSAFFDPQEQFGILLDEPASTPAGAAEEAPKFDCDFEDSDAGDMPPWLARRFSPERLKLLCERLALDGAQSFVDRMLDNVAVALYVLLPLMALVLKVLYPLSRRYYVEHLLFVVHFHAFVFLALLVQLLASAVGDSIRSGWGVFLQMLIPLYVLIYLYKAMRHVYRQRRAVTLFKYLLLLLVYFGSFIVMLSTAAVIAAISL